MFASLVSNGNINNDNHYHVNFILFRFSGKIDLFYECTHFLDFINNFQFINSLKLFIFIRCYPHHTKTLHFYLVPICVL